MELFGYYGVIIMFYCLDLNKVAHCRRHEVMNITDTVWNMTRISLFTNVQFMFISLVESNLVVVNFMENLCTVEF